MPGTVRQRKFLYIGIPIALYSVLDENLPEHFDDTVQRSPEFKIRLRHHGHRDAFQGLRRPLREPV